MDETLRQPSPKILIVEDDPESLRSLEERFQAIRYTTYSAPDGEAALLAVKEYHPDVVLLDLSLPDMDGFRVCQVLKEEEESRDIPIIFLAARADVDALAQGLRVGGHDFVTKPSHPLELLARVDAALRVKFLQDELRLHAMTDPLTGLKNRRYLLRRLEEELERSRRTEEPLAFVMIDLDDFKEVNDRSGHWRGDQILREAGRVLTQGARFPDVVVRYGGDEFAALLPQTPLRGAATVAERMRRQVEAQPFLTEAGELHLTISVGLAATSGVFVGTGETLIRTADQALYQAKKRGKNQVLAVPCEG